MSVVITVVIPTRNRAFALKEVLSTYYQQKHVDQIVIVNDSASDNTEEVIRTTAVRYPSVHTVLLKNDHPQGAAFSRNRGVIAAKNSYVLFGEDDAFLEENYAAILWEKLKAPGVGIVSGRLITLYPRETPHRALVRFGHGNPRCKKPFSLTAFCHLPDAYYQGDLQLPLTHAMILTYKELLLKYPYDPYYGKGNGFREESDFQIRTFLNGHTILVTSDTHALHLHPQDVKVGGHRISIVKGVGYKIYYTHYFFKKHYSQIRKKLQLKLPRHLALFVYVFTQINELTRAFGHWIQKKVYR